MNQHPTLPLICSHSACEQQLAGPVPYCPYCGQKQPIAVAVDKHPVAPPPLPSAVPDPLSAPTPLPQQAPLQQPAQAIIQARTAPPGATTPPTQTRPRQPEPRSRAPILIGGVFVAGVIWALFFRGSDDRDKLDVNMIQTWRSNVMRCVQSNDLICAEHNLNQLRAQAPATYWSDLQQSTQDLARRLSQESQHRVKAELEAQHAQQLALQRAQLEKDLADSQAQALAAAELAVPSPQPNSQIPLINRPARADATSQSRNPPRYPPGALRDATNSSVVLDIDIDALGNPTRVAIARSSGSRAVDRAAREAAQRWRYEPAVANGQPVIGSLQQQIDLVIDDQATVPNDSSNRQRADIGTTDLLVKAQRELAAGRYDVALALGESALQASPSSQEARELIQRAKAERSRVMRETTID